MNYIKNKRKKDRRKIKRFLGNFRRHQDKKETKIVLQDTIIWIICLSVAVSILGIMLFLGYLKG